MDWWKLAVFVTKSEPDGVNPVQVTSKSGELPFAVAMLSL